MEGREHMEEIRTSEDIDQDETEILVNKDNFRRSSKKRKNLRLGIESGDPYDK